VIDCRRTSKRLELLGIAAGGASALSWIGVSGLLIMCAIAPRHVGPGAGCAAREEIVMVVARTTVALAIGDRALRVACTWYVR